jgi:hypothetical protein
MTDVARTHRGPSGTVVGVKRQASRDRTDRVAAAEKRASDHLAAASAAAEAGRLGEFVATLPKVKDQVAGGGRRAATSD